MKEASKKELKFYGRIGISVVLYALFMIFSVSAVLTGTLADQPFLIGGLLVGAVLLLPRRAPRPQKEDDLTKEEVVRLNHVQKWLTWVRVGYFIMVAFLWFGLPELM
jgi:hypothetical protein